MGVPAQDLREGPLFLCPPTYRPIRRDGGRRYVRSQHRCRPPLADRQAGS